MWGLFLLLRRLNYMEGRHRQQHSIMNFAVPFLELVTLYMLWRAQILSEFYDVFCVCQILILQKLKAKIWYERVTQKGILFFLLLAI